MSVVNHRLRLVNTCEPAGRINTDDTEDVLFIRGRYDTVEGGMEVMDTMDGIEVMDIMDVSGAVLVSMT